jgi:prepilin-type N-terminal cleavage/methylation domain-containing protein
MRSSIRRLSSRGDTIVEVLIAIAIVSSVLAGAFTVSQKSTLAVRDSQERGEVLQILQGQVEQVRALALDQSDDTSGVYATTPKYF